MSKSSGPVAVPAGASATPDDAFTRLHEQLRYEHDELDNGWIDNVNADDLAALLSEVDRLRANLAALDTDYGVLLAESTEQGRARLAAEQRAARYEAAIGWALGENGAFNDEEPPPLVGKYRRRFYWRAELRSRAFGSDAAAGTTGGGAHAR